MHKVGDVLHDTREHGPMQVCAALQQLLHLRRCNDAVRYWAA
jgi:hypothetical protein